MIEAVNSVISNAPLIRANADQVATTQSFAANDLAVKTVARMPLAPYISPYISVNVDYDKAVLQLRDSDTGDVVNQFPSEQTLEARRRAENAQLNAKLAESAGGSAPERSAASNIGGRTALGANVPQGITVVQESASSSPSPSGGAGVAQAAIAALSLGASAGQPTSTVSVTA